jgi:hypothetical protein
MGQFDIFSVMAKSKISFQSIRQFARFIWEVTSERMEAIKVLDSPIIQNEIPRYVVIKKGIIKDVPEDMDLESFMQQLNSDNHNKQRIPFQMNDALGLRESKRRTKKPREKDGCGKSRGQYV